MSLSGLGNVIGSSRSARIVAKRFFKSAEQVDSLDFVMRMILIDAREITKTQIESGGRRGGGSYAQLKLGTIEKKGTMQILKTEGANEKYSAFSKMGRENTLFRSLTQEGAPYSIARSTKTGFEYGTKRPWAYVHQKGSSKRRIPARPFIQILPGDMRRWQIWVGRYLVEPFDRPVSEGESGI